METAVSLPDDMFQGAAERLARRTSKIRGWRDVDAGAEHLARHSPDEVTEAMDRVVDRLCETVSDDFVARGTHQTLRRMEW